MRPAGFVTNLLAESEKRRRQIFVPKQLPKNCKPLTALKA